MPSPPLSKSDAMISPGTATGEPENGVDAAASTVGANLLLLAPVTPVARIAHAHAAQMKCLIDASVHVVMTRMGRQTPGPTRNCAFCWGRRLNVPEAYVSVAPQNSTVS